MEQSGVCQIPKMDSPYSHPMISIKQIRKITIKVMRLGEESFAYTQVSSSSELNL